MEAFEELAQAVRQFAESTRPSAEALASLGIEINRVTNKPKTTKRMKAKAYFMSLGRVILLSPFLLSGVLVLAVAILLKSVGYCLIGDFDAATREIKAI